MNENRNRPEAELNDAALEGVSGGLSSKCSHKDPGLAKYLQENDILYCTDDPCNCPYHP